MHKFKKSLWSRITVTFDWLKQRHKRERGFKESLTVSVWGPVSGDVIYLNMEERNFEGKRIN